MSRKKKVLIIAYYWPPASSPGVQRWLKFVKFLHLNKRNPIVVTTSNGSYPAIDPSLADDIHKEIKVFYTKSVEPILLYNLLQGKNSNSVAVGMPEIKTPKNIIQKIAKKIRADLFVPDAKIGWYYYARKTILNLVKKEKVDIVITTGPPHTAHLFGQYLKEKLNIRWIADFRDPWTTIFYEEYLGRGPRAKLKNQKLEKKVLENCDHIITVSTGLEQEFNHYKDKLSLIPNGYDDEDFMELKNIQTEYFYIVYTGNLKINQNIEAFYKAIVELRNESENLSQLFRLKFIGNINDEIKSTLIEFSLEEIVEYLPFKEHHEAIIEMQRANCLYLPIPKSKNSHLILTGKIFEYLASRSPILAVGPKKGNASKLLEECNRAPMLAYEDKAGIKDRIKLLFEEWVNHDKVSSKIESNNHEVYSRERLTEQLIELL